MTSALVCGRIALISALAAALACSESLPPTVEPSGDAAWQPLLTAEGTLDGWRPLGGSADYRVEDGDEGPEIVGTASDEARNTFLATAQDYGDFELQLEFLVDPELNSGVQFRSAVRQAGEQGESTVYGYQAEIDPSPRAWTAGIYDEAHRGWLYPLTLNAPARAAFRPGEWNQLRVVAVGTAMRTWLNGTPASYLVDDEASSGFIALQVHAAPPPQHGKEVRWRNLRIRSATAAMLQSTAPAGVPSVPFVVNTLRNQLSDAEREQGWELLFDGETTSGWRGAHAKSFPPSGWQVSEGILSVLGTTGGEAAGGGDIVSEREYGAFELQLEFLLSEGANSGIKYFVTEDYASSGSAIGVEYQLLDDERHPDAKMGRDGNRTLASLYDLIAAEKQPRFVRPPGEWNHARLLVRPDRSVEHWLNHQQVLAYTLGSPEFLALVQRSKYKDWDGFGLWTAGHLLLQDHGDDVSFRSIKVRDLGALEELP